LKNKLFFIFLLFTSYFFYLPDLTDILSSQTVLFGFSVSHNSFGSRNNGDAEFISHIFNFFIFYINTLALLADLLYFLYSWRFFGAGNFIIF